MFLSALFPASARRTATRAGISAFCLALLVLLLFPRSALAGTENAFMRGTTAVALTLAGFALVRSRGRIVFVVGAGVLLLVAAIVVGAPWLLLFAAVACLYTAAGLLRDRMAAGRAAVDPHEVYVEPDELREIVEAIGTALVLALVVREFGFEAFKIPTGSMEPTILGDDRYSERTGDRLLAFKPMPSFRGPERWEIWVFRFPLYRPTNYIKRIVGIGGEHLELRSGDVYVGSPARIVSKPDTVQEAMWKPAFDQAERDGGVDDYFRASGTGFTLMPHAAIVAAPAGPLQWMRCTESFRNDLRATMKVANAQWEAGGVLALKINSANGEVLLQVSSDGATVTAPGADGGKPEAHDIALSGAKLGRSFTLSLSASDRIVRVAVNGEQVATFAYADVQQKKRQDTGQFEVGAAGFAGELSNFIGENDTEYVTDESWDLGEGEYIALGDNVKSSQDSRMWTTNVITTTTGHVYTAPDSARIHSEDRVEQNLRATESGGLEFYDSYGVKRVLAKDEIATTERNKSAPFVHRSDLVGPAFLIFWPLSSNGNTRPRIVR